MKYLTILRHAKSKHKLDYAMDDRDRPLNGRGKEACIETGEFLAAEPSLPELILTSDAKRAQDTTTRVLRAMRQNITIQSVPSLYLATAGEIIKEVAKVDNAISHVMVVGHNPGLHSLALFLTQNSSHIPDALRENLATATLVRVSFDHQDWHALSPEHTRFDVYFKPNKHKTLPG